jgi:hypothetical protein
VEAVGDVLENRAHLGEVRGELVAGLDERGNGERSLLRGRRARTGFGHVSRESDHLGLDAGEPLVEVVGELDEAGVHLDRRISERVDVTRGGLVFLNAEALGWLLSRGELDFLEEGGDRRGGAGRGSGRGRCLALALALGIAGKKPLELGVSRLLVVDEGGERGSL